MDLVNEKLKFIDSYFQIVHFDLAGNIVDSSEDILIFYLKEMQTISSHC